MIKIKDNIINENKIINISINEDNNLEIDIEHSFPIVIKNANFSDIEWNYENIISESLSYDLAKARIKELEEELKIVKNICYNQAQRIKNAKEYIGNGNLGIPRKTREKFIKY